MRKICLIFASSAAVALFATPAFASTVTNSTIVTYGQCGTTVKTLQNDLNRFGFYVGSADGVFSEQTLEQVNAFQQASNLPANGVVGSSTWAALAKPDLIDYAKTLPRHTAVGASFNWVQPTGGLYPSIKNDHSLWIHASLSQQRIYTMNGNSLIYTMITSSGIPNAKDYTPTGTYYIQNRGLWFYNSEDQEGAQYWVSWKGWGDYLFHTVPMNAEQQVIPSVAEELGVPASHGCFHLTIDDAKWIYDHIPMGAKVVITK